MNYLKISLIFAIICLFSTTGLCEDKDPVAVNPIKVINSSHQRCKINPSIVTMMLEKELAKTGQFSLIDRSTAFHSPELLEASESADYSAYNASYIGTLAEVPYIVMGRMRPYYDKVYFQFGLFDVQIQEQVREVKGFFSTDLATLAEKDMPEIARKLAGLAKTPKPAEKPKKELAQQVAPKKSSAWKWMALGAVTTSVAYLIGTLSQQAPEETKEESQTVVSLSW